MRTGFSEIILNELCFLTLPNLAELADKIVWPLRLCFGLIRPVLCRRSSSRFLDHITLSLLGFHPRTIEMRRRLLAGTLFRWCS